MVALVCISIPDGVHDFLTERCDDGQLNSPEGFCGLDCTLNCEGLIAEDGTCCPLSCPEVQPPDGMIASLYLATNQVTDEVNVTCADGGTWILGYASGSVGRV